MLSDADLEYIRTEFVLLSDLCNSAGENIEEVRAAIAARRLPAPPYADIEYVPANYFELPDADEFQRTFTGDAPDEVLRAYLDGTYFVCVRNATVEEIARKNQLVEEIRALRANPRPEDQDWHSRLHVRVDELDEIERPFSPDFDRIRFGRLVTRDELIEGTRQLYPRDSAV